jgi:uncharacterized protein (DUF2062 family)
MPRKLFRKFLPSHDTIRQNRYVACFGPRLQHPNLWHLHRRGVAGGVAAGMFAGLVPGSNPVQFLVASLLAIAFRVNLPIAVAVTLYSNPLTVVPLYYAAFKLGQLVLLRSDADIPSIATVIEGKGFLEALSGAIEWLGDVGYPLLVGLPLLALILAVIGYVLVDWGWRVHVRMEWRRRQLRRAQQASR